MDKNILNHIESEIKKDDFLEYYVCKCGYYKVPSFGKKFFIDPNICPKCGTHKDEWKHEIRRRIPRQKIIIKEHWEVKK